MFVRNVKTNSGIKQLKNAITVRKFGKNQLIMFVKIDVKKISSGPTITKLAPIVRLLGKQLLITSVKFAI